MPQIKKTPLHGSNSSHFIDMRAVETRVDKTLQRETLVHMHASIMPFSQKSVSYPYTQIVAPNHCIQCSLSTFEQCLVLPEFVFTLS